MIKILFNDVERKIKEAPDKRIYLKDFPQEYSSREFTFIDMNGAHYIEKGDDSEKPEQYIAWFAMPQALSLKIYNYVMDIK